MLQADGFDVVGEDRERCVRPRARRAYDPTSCSSTSSSPTSTSSKSLHGADRERRRTAGRADLRPRRGGLRSARRAERRVRVRPQGGALGRCSQGCAWINPCAASSGQSSLRGSSRPQWVSRSCFRATANRPRIHRRDQPRRGVVVHRLRHRRDVAPSHRRAVRASHVWRRPDVVSELSDRVQQQLPRLLVQEPLVGHPLALFLHALLTFPRGYLGTKLVARPLARPTDW